jgi:hypothetical protein
MDFFEAQARAHQRTKRLVFLFAFAVLGTVLAGYASVMFGLRYAGDIERQTRPTGSRHQAAKTALFTGWWEPRIFLWTVSMATSPSSASPPSTSGPRVLRRRQCGRREWSAAAVWTAHHRPATNAACSTSSRRWPSPPASPCPPSTCMDDEPGHQRLRRRPHHQRRRRRRHPRHPRKLSRDELQGVVAHEFSHILNGDMRLNVRLTAIVFGILVIGLLGRGLLSGAFPGPRPLRRQKKGRRDRGHPVIGLALMIIGYIGYFFGRLIQAAVSRQREFLADASAVQFTRNPGGITGALKKIGGYALGSIVNPTRAPPSATSSSPKVPLPLRRPLGHPSAARRTHPRHRSIVGRPTL